MKKITLTTIFLLSLIFVCSCSEPGPVEKAGERIDEIGDNIKEGEDPLKKKGTAEKVGETIDETLNGDSR